MPLKTHNISLLNSEGYVSCMSCRSVVTVGVNRWWECEGKALRSERGRWRVGCESRHRRTDLAPTARHVCFPWALAIAHQLCSTHACCCIDSAVGRCVRRSDQTGRPVADHERLPHNQHPKSSHIGTQWAYPQDSDVTPIPRTWLMRCDIRQVAPSRREWAPSLQVHTCARHSVGGTMTSSSSRWQSTVIERKESRMHALRFKRVQSGVWLHADRSQIRRDSGSSTLA
jgi:hypothetical protein